MQARIIRETFTRRKKRIALALLAVFLGAALASALLTVYSDITSKMSRELRSYGANILVRPDSEGLEMDIGGISYSPPGAKALLDERELPKVKTIFWKNNITGIVPTLNAVVTVGDQPVVLTGIWFEKKLDIPQLGAKQFAGKSSDSTAGSFTTGARSVFSWWDVKGRWAEDGEDNAAMVGAAVARQLSLSPGDTFGASYQGRTLELQAVATVSTGGPEDYQVFVALPAAQRLAGLSHGVDRVVVSALVTPPGKIPPAIRDKDPKDMTPEEYELWYCTPLVESIAYQVGEVVTGSRPEAIRQVSEAEASFVGSTQLLMLLLAGMVLASSAMGVMAIMFAMVAERRHEIGLMKAMGAQNWQVAWLFLLEAGIIGLAGGLLGYLGGLGLAQFLGRQVFGEPFSFSITVLPTTLSISILVAVLGAALPVSRGVTIEPVTLLRES